MDPLLTCSAIELAHKIRRGEVSAREVVDVHIRHVEKVNPSLNAMVADRFAAARDEAGAADRAREAGADLGPLHGVPCSIKESFALTGMPFTSGLVARRGTIAERDAVGVARLRKAGAIPLGVTNVSELCMWMESNNRVYGLSNNPYDPRRTAGGSSGGEGAIVGAGGTPFGLGADIGGSIRMPAFFNGVFGHKPTGGLVDNGGQYPLPAEGALNYVTTGPLARRAEDLAPLLRVLADRDIGDPASVDIASLEVISVEDDGRIGVTDDLRRAQEDALRALAARGARVRTAKIAGFARSIEIWGAMLDAAGGPSFSTLLGNGREIAAARELVRLALGRSPYTLPAVALALVEKLPKLLPQHGTRFLELGAALKQELRDLLGTRGVMLYPSHRLPAPKHHLSLFQPWNWGYTAILNVMELPVTQVPLGLNTDGVPLGVQVAAIHGSDHVTIAVALALEKAFGGWVPPRLAKS
ncbi:Glutamyl-tRNA(Gln) amidotransferase subunit A [Minicystis rosea]|nr:Glutamyl-tRNA(Gln) amidotransferase subunit A [Minicystis rosea]